ncbi:MAG: AAA family ATPase [Nitrospinaceae bacterium]
MKTLKREIDLCIRARYPLLYLLTWEEDRGEALLADVARASGKEIVVWSCTQGFRPPPAQGKNPLGPEAALKCIHASSQKAVFVLRDFHPFLETGSVVRHLRDLTAQLKRSYKTVVLISPILRIPPELEKEMTIFDLPLPDEAELTTVLNEFLKPHRGSSKVTVNLTPGLVERVVRATTGLTRAEAENVYAKALIHDRKFDAADLPNIIEEKKRLIRKSGILDFIGLSTQLGNVGGLNRLKAWLRQRSQAFGLRARRYGLPDPKGVLMVGVQGCGKSLAAKAIAAEWRLPLLRLDVGKIFDSFIGHSEDNMRKAIAQAEAMSPACLWLDEIEKGFAGTQSSGQGDSGVSARVFGTFLTWMQEKTRPVFVIATANNIEQLPPELLRKGRFDEIFFVDLPREEERVDIFEIHIRLKKRNPEDYDLQALAAAAQHFSGAEIEEAVVSAMYGAFAENREFGGEDILKAIRETVPLAVTAQERVAGLREWAKQRARPAS